LFETEFLAPNAESTDAYQMLIHQVAEIVCTALPKQSYSARSPRELEQLVNGEVLPDTEGSWDELAGLLRTVVANSAIVTHPYTAAHLHCPPLLAALAAEVVISAMNQSMDSFDQAPIASIVEQKMIRSLCQEVGLPDTADGTFTTGGSQSNYMGLLLARDASLLNHWNWPAQKAGIPPEVRRLRILCSEVAHFTVEKCASQLGLGTDSIVKIDVDECFRMNARVLRERLASLRQQKLVPMAIVATAGTTDFGSIDPLPEVAALARESGAWLHVDAAYGGALLFSAQQRHKLVGIDAADSIGIDFHKLFWQPIPCSAFLLRDARHFVLIKMYADYLNPESHEEEGIPNLVTTSLLTSRRFDALKLWISFQALGRAKLAAMIDRTAELANHAADVIRRNPKFELICQPQLSTVVFRYRPSRTGVDANTLNARLRQNLFQSGKAIIGHTRVKQQQCLKFTCMNPATSEEHLVALIAMIESEGEKLESGFDTSLLT